MVDMKGGFMYYPGYSQAEQVDAGYAAVLVRRNQDIVEEAERLIELIQVTHPEEAARLAARLCFLHSRLLVPPPD